jgi:diguanylate cyclase (GGDEF)-like protein
MQSVAQRAETGMVRACVFFAVVTAGVGLVGVLGIRSTTAVGTSIVRDELATETITAIASRSIDHAYGVGLGVVLSSDPATDPSASQLYQQEIPATDAQVADLVRQHAGDAPEERAGISLLSAQWVAVRTVLNPTAIARLSGPSQPLAAQLRAAYAPLSVHLDQLLTREQVDADAGKARARATEKRTVWIIGLAVAIAELVTLVMCRAGIRRIKRSAEPEEDQIEFAETLQLAKNEEEAHELLQRHLERIIPDTTATVLNRNNSADRLEAVTELPPGSTLVASLRDAEPQSCLAVRSGRRNDQGSDRRRLLVCGVCGDCPGTSTCTPLTNLRNLAIAEVRAATDSLTGLPNKRAVGDTLKRMVAQASRSLSPVTLILIDLDHFKDINDRLGHPVGDQALASVGAVLLSVLRDSDFAGRNGGEEFAVLLPGTDVEGAAQTAEKIRQAIAEIGLPSPDMAVTASLGLASYPEHATTSERLERLADAALYTAKRGGRNRVEIAVVTNGPSVTA